MRRVVGVVVFALASGLVPSEAIHAAPPGQVNLCYQFFPMIDWYTDCYSRAQRAIAERRMLMRPVSPGQVVWRLTGLPLRFIALLTFNLPHTPRLQTTQINYFYGRQDGAGNPDSRFPGYDYVLVTESGGRLARSGMLFDRADSHAPWNLRMNVPHRYLVLQIQSTRGRDLEREVAVALLARAGRS